ncbi:MAG: hypothetical protein Q3976_00170 [Corynebacterium sp.]|nr:hypothetical protein [Corynebacterium sp.]
MTAYWTVLLFQAETTIGTNSNIQILEVPGNFELEILQELTQIADENSETITVQLAEANQQHLYVAGAKASDWINTGYPTLFPHEKYQVSELTALPYGDARQLYELSGGDDFTNTIRDFLDAKDVKYESLGYFNWDFLYDGTPLSKVMLLFIFLIASLSISSILVDARAYAIKNLLGFGIFHSYFTNFFMALRQRWIPLAIIFLAGSAAILSTSGVQRYRQVLEYWVAYSACFLAVLLVSGIVTLAITRLTPLVAALKGKVASGYVLTLVAATRIMGLILLSAIALPALNLTTEYSKQMIDRPIAAENNDVFFLQLSGARTFEGIEADTAQLASAIRAQSAQGNALYATYLDSGIGNTSANGDRMIYNASGAKESLRNFPKDELTQLTAEKPLVVLPPGATGAQADPQLLFPTECQEANACAVIRATHSFQAKNVGSELLKLDEPRINHKSHCSRLPRCKSLGK